MSPSHNCTQSTLTYTIVLSILPCHCQHPALHVSYLALHDPHPRPSVGLMQFSRMNGLTALLWIVFDDCGIAQRVLMQPLQPTVSQSRVKVSVDSLSVSPCSSFMMHLVDSCLLLLKPVPNSWMPSMPLLWNTNGARQCEMHACCRFGQSGRARLGTADSRAQR